MTFSQSPNSQAVQVIVMGVAGCGKSAVGQLLAQQLLLPLVEGDNFHPAANILKMRQGIALADEDRNGWLDALGQQLAQHANGLVLTCSALKASYRDRLRQASVDAGLSLRFVYLAISPAESLRRVGQRAGHFYPPSLVASQFVTLEDPSCEPDVFWLDGEQSLELLAQQAVAWLGTNSTGMDRSQARI